MLRFPLLAVPVICAVLAGCALPSIPASAPMIGGLQCGPQAYPFNALQDWQWGQVLVRAQVGADGRLGQGVVEQPAPSPYLNAAAVDAMRQCRTVAAAPGTTVRAVVVYELVNRDEYLPRGVVYVVPAP
jgi:TonB family protein